MSLNAVITQKCPKCEEGKIFGGIFKMNPTCLSCGMKFEREQGYFTTAIVIANFLYALIIAPVMLFMTAKKVAVSEIILLLLSISLIMVPLIFRVARTLWLHFDFALNPE